MALIEIDGLPNLIAWWFSIAMLNYQRVLKKKKTEKWHVQQPDMGIHPWRLENRRLPEILVTKVGPRELLNAHAQIDRPHVQE